ENHPFFSYDGWQPLAALRQGDRIAVPRHVPSPRALTSGWSEAEVRGAARLCARTGLDVPLEISSLPKEQIALFLHELYAVAGSIDESAGADGAVILDCPQGLRSEAVARLLLRFGISTRHVAASLVVDQRDSIRRMLQEIGVGRGGGRR